MASRWHWPPENWCGRRPSTIGRLMPDVVERGVHALARSPSFGTPCDGEALADDVPHLAARVERRHRVLEDHLEPRRRTARASPGATALPSSLPSEADRPVTGRSRAAGRRSIARPGRRLAAARLADEAERLVRGSTSKRDARDRLNRPPTAPEATRRPCPRRGAARRRGACQRLVAAGGSPASSALMRRGPVGPPGRGRRTCARPIAPPDSGGYSVPHCSIATSQRGANGQPGVGREELRRPAGNLAQARVRRLVRPRDRRDERLGVAVARWSEDRLASARARRSGRRT